MTYRLLRVEEWERLIPIFSELGQEPPPPTVASVAVAENGDGEIAGLLVLQIAMHMEPLILLDKKASFLGLQNEMETTLRKGLVNGNHLTYYCFSDSEKVERMAELGGLSKIEGRTVWEKEV